MNVSKPLIRRPVATTLLTIGLSIAAVLGAGLAVTKALSLAMCRGVACIAWVGETEGRVHKADLVDTCFYLGAPTGMGIFNNRQFGQAANFLVGLEYAFLGTEYLFITPHSPADPIILIDARRYLVGIPHEEFCNRGSIALRLDADRRRIDISGCPFGSLTPMGRGPECQIEKDVYDQTYSGAGSAP